MLKFLIIILAYCLLGDIEKAEENILKEIDANVLKNNILKISHHGSKTSTSEEFLKSVNPNAVLIGVGINNKFGHPNMEVIERIKKYGAKIYRTDEMGEIELVINKKGEVKVKTKINCN